MKQPTAVEAMKTSREFRQEKEYPFDHFCKLTKTGIEPDYVNIELFAYDYAKEVVKQLNKTK